VKRDGVCAGYIRYCDMNLVTAHVQNVSCKPRKC